MKNLFLKMVLLVMTGCSVVGSSKKNMSSYNPNFYNASGTITGWIMGGALARKVFFKSIHEAFKTHPIESPYKRYLVKSALVAGYVSVCFVAGAVGGCMADEYEDAKLSDLERILKYAWRRAGL